MKHQIRRALFLTPCLVASAGAAEFVPLFGIEYEQHSNAARSSTNEVKDSAIKPYAGVYFNEESSTMNASVNAKVTHERWTDETFDSQNLYSIDGFIDWIISPGRFLWALEDFAYSQRIDVLQPSTSGNLQNFNYIATGPDFILSRGPWESVFKLRVGNVYYSETDTDNNRVSGSAVLKRFLNDYSDVSLDLAMTRVAFTVDYLNEYNIGMATVKYRRDLPHGNLLVGAGTSHFSQEGGDSKSAPAAYLRYRFGDRDSASKFRLALSHNISDPALDAYDPLYTRLYDFAGERLINPGEITGVGAYELTKAEGVFSYDTARVNVTVAGYGNNKKYYETANINSEERGASLGLSYNFNDRLAVFGFVNQVNVDFPNSGIHVDSSFPQLGLSYSLNDQLSMAVGAGQSRNKSNDPRLDYDDDLVFFRMDYKGVSKGEEPKPTRERD